MMKKVVLVSVIVLALAAWLQQPRIMSLTQCNKYASEQNKELPKMYGNNAEHQNIECVPNGEGKIDLRYNYEIKARRSDFREGHSVEAFLNDIRVGMVTSWCKNSSTKVLLDKFDGIRIATVTIDRDPLGEIRISKQDCR